MFHMASYEWRREAYVSASGGTRVKTPNYVGSLVDSCFSSFFRRNTSNTNTNTKSASLKAPSRLLSFCEAARTRMPLLPPPPPWRPQVRASCDVYFSDFLRNFGSLMLIFLSFDELIPLFYLFIYLFLPLKWKRGARVDSGEWRWSLTGRTDFSREKAAEWAWSGLS